MRHLLTSLALLATFAAAGQVDGFQLPYNPDVEPDGYIGTADLLELLTVFGEEFSSDELMVSADSTAMIIQVGDLMTDIECLSSCVNLSGSWRVVSRIDLARFLPQLSEGVVPYNGYLGIGIEDYDGLEYMWVDQRGSINSVLHASELSPYRKNEEMGHDGDNNVVVYHPPLTVSITTAELPVREHAECWCATHERPKVEYYLYSSSTGNGSLDAIQGALDELASEGWKVLTPYEGNKLVFWRYAE